LTLKTNSQHTEGKREFPISLQNGLIGLEEYTDFKVVVDPAISPLRLIDSITKPGLGFIAVEPWVVCPTYQFDLDDSIVAELGIRDSNDVWVLCLAVIPKRIEDMTVNLKSPLVINIWNGQARQVVLVDDEYSIRHKVNPKTRESKCS
jgi:flagellar assembly factor FliW